MHILTEILTEIGHKIILTENLTDFGQNFSLHMPAQGSCLQFFDRTVGQNSVTRPNFDRNCRSIFRSKFFPPHASPGDQVCNFLTEQSVKIQSTDLILTEIVGQNFGQTIILTEFRSKCRSNRNFVTDRS